MYAILALFRLVIYILRIVRGWLNSVRSEGWPSEEAIVTADPARFTALAGSTVEVPYTYHFQGELYIGLHEEPSFDGVGSKFMRRFAKGRRFLVRVNPEKPEVSVMRDRDQGDDIQEYLEQVDEEGRPVLVQK